MNKNKFTEFFKGKGYYVLLFIGVLAIAGVAVIGSQLSSNTKDGDQNYAQLNDTDDNIAAKDSKTQMAENNPVSEGIVNNANNSKDTASKDQAELEGYGEDTAAAEANSQAVVNESKDSAKNETPALSFHADNGLLWPVKGDVIMNYSMDHTIYFATLMEYKTNPAIIIGAKVGTDVKAAANGTVTKIDADNEETGYTVTMDIGSGYSVIYGQLNKDSVSLKVGDSVKEGAIIGTVADPTNYYTVEGSNLYFEVMNNDQTVNPMLLLR